MTTGIRGVLPLRIVASIVLVGLVASCGAATSSGTTPLPSARPSLALVPQQLRFSGAVSGALTTGVVPVCGAASGQAFALGVSGKVADRVRVSFSLQVSPFAGAGTYSFDQGRGFVLLYGPPRTTYYIGSSALARRDTLTVNAGEKSGAVSVAFYTTSSDQQPAVRLVGTWRCQSP